MNHVFVVTKEETIMVSSLSIVEGGNNVYIHSHR